MRWHRRRRSEAEKAREFVQRTLAEPTPQWLTDIVAQRPPPDPPVNVRLVLGDGTEVPVDTLYRGRRGGTHEWEVVNPPLDRGVRRVLIEALPPRTTVVVPLRGEL